MRILPNINKEYAVETVRVLCGISALAPRAAHSAASRAKFTPRANILSSLRPERMARHA